MGAKATGDSNRTGKLCVEPMPENVEPWEDTLKISRADRKQRGDKRMRNARKKKKQFLRTVVGLWAQNNQGHIQASLHFAYGQLP